MLFIILKIKQNLIQTLTKKTPQGDNVNGDNYNVNVNHSKIKNYLKMQWPSLVPHDQEKGYGSLFRHRNLPTIYHWRRIEDYGELL